jgi:hypothetical protein
VSLCINDVVLSNVLHSIIVTVLSENLLYGQIPDELSSMPSLQVFSAFRSEKSGPRLSGSLPSFNKAPQLTRLYLQENEIRGSIPPDFLSASLSAKEVFMSYNSLTGAVPSDLDSIPGLNLQLEGNQLSELPTGFCDNDDWMEGAVQTNGCDAILCSPGSASQIGRAANESTLCANCTRASSAIYYGSTSCEGPPRDRDILVNLYNALNGDNWFRNDFWGTTIGVCDWYGIGCINGQVVAINLRANNLNGLPGPDLFFLRELQILWLYSNPITFSFENVGSARKLQDLRLDSTNLHSIHGIGAATSLIVLDVRFTAVKGIFPRELLQLINLRTLSLGGNGLTGTLPSSFANLRLLNSLGLDSNHFTGQLPSFDDMHFLETLNLANNAFTGAISKRFLDKLATVGDNIYINLAQNQITGVVPEELSRFQKLSLYLRENRVLGLPLSLCDSYRWNDGDVGNFGCDAIMCKPGTANEHGRRRAGFPCVSCPDARYYGETACNSVSSSSRLKSLAVTTVGLGVILLVLL